MPWIDEARLLLRKAAQDAVVVRVCIDDPDISDEIAGFHTQQACEKALKAVLSAKGITFPFTHNLVQLLDIVSAANVVVPAKIADVGDWTPFAAFFRYAEWSAAAPLDRSEALDAVNATIAWATTIVDNEATSAQGL
jgi:hypothetical protein